MRFAVTLFTALVGAAALFAVAIVGGNLFLDGRPLPVASAVKTVVPVAQEQQVATPSAPAAAPAVAEASTTTPVAEAAPAPAPAPAAFDKATYVADAKRGEKLIGKCKACHTFGNAEPNRVGPNLFGVVERKVAAHEGFAYSDAMKGKAADLGTWTEDNLFTYLENPKTLVPGTKMAFAGLKDPAERLDLIAYLKTLK